MASVRGIADLNLDGFLDALVVTGRANEINQPGELLLGMGDGTFIRSDTISQTTLGEGNDVSVLSSQWSPCSRDHEWRRFFFDLWPPPVDRVHRPGKGTL